MTKRDETDKRKQTTAKGQEIPVPKRGDFFRNLKKIARPDLNGKSRPKQ